MRALVQRENDITSFGALLMELPPQVVFIKRLELAVSEPDDYLDMALYCDDRPILLPRSLERDISLELEIGCDRESAEKIRKYQYGEYRPSLMYPDELIVKVQEGHTTAREAHISQHMIRNAESFSALVYHLLKQMGWKLRGKAVEDVKKVAKIAAAQAHILKRKVKIF